MSVASAEEVDAIARACAAAGSMALDLEFVSQDRYRPDLALVQVAWTDPASGAVEVRLVDPLAVDAAPIVRLAGGEVDVIVHAARQDMQILATRFGLRARRLFDTQIAAAFVSLGDQIGYARLVDALVGERIDKDAQWTDWLRRPLGASQLRYAAADVRHLPALATTLRARLDQLGRRSWAEAECDVVAEVAWQAAQLTPAEAWREVGGTRGLDAPARAVAMRLAAWRLETAEAENKPPSWLLPDRSLLIEVARARPQDERALRALRLPEGTRRRAGEILAAVIGSVEDDQAIDAAPELELAAAAPGAPGPRVALWEEVIVALVQGASEDTGIPPRLVAARGDAEALARAVDARGGAIDAVVHPLLSGWRREVVGERIASWFRGDRALIADPTATLGVRLDDRRRPG